MIFIFFIRFLSTLERHFKNVTHGATFRVVTETIPKMMSALRMVWIISRHYNRDERMVPLMERIANQLCDRVARSINVRTLFRYFELFFKFRFYYSLKLSTE
jgi:dynein heavy chain